MVQPLKNKAQPFCLTIFGTDNKFSHINVMDRWKYIIENLENVGISVMGFSSDGDAKLLKAMKVKTELGCSSEKNLTVTTEFKFQNWYASNIKSDYNYTQDTIHIGCKLRNRMLKASISLPIGRYQISKAHLKYLLETTSKDLHQLSDNVVDPKDRQNYRSLEKTFQPNVLKALEDHVPESSGTILFLKICKLVTSAYLDQNLTPLERVYNFWHGLFILRGWRTWIKNMPQYSLSDNFITSNAYNCIELNGHSLINVIQTFREKNMEHLFLPHLMTSQPCESTFRAIRSISSTYSTQVNASMLEIMHRLKRIQLQGDIASTDDMKEIHFPNLNNRSEIQNCSSTPITQQKLPQNSEIIQTINQAREDSGSELSSIGIHLNDEELQFKCMIRFEKDEILDDDDFYDEEISSEIAPGE